MQEEQAQLVQAAVRNAGAMLLPVVQQQQVALAEQSRAMDTVLAAERQQCP